MYETSFVVVSLVTLFDLAVTTFSLYDAVKDRYPLVVSGGLSLSAVAFTLIAYSFLQANAGYIEHGNYKYTTTAGKNVITQTVTVNATQIDFFGLTYSNWLVILLLVVLLSFLVRLASFRPSSPRLYIEG